MPAQYRADQCWFAIDNFWQFERLRIIDPLPDFALSSVKRIRNVSACASPATTGGPVVAHQPLRLTQRNAPRSGGG